MGVENNNAIVATTWSKEEVDRISRFIESLPGEDGKMFVVGPPLINNKTTVVMLPDGSKKGWAESEACDELRDRFVVELEKSNYGDGSNPWDFVEVGFGEFGQKVLRGNCKNMYGDEEYAG